MDKNDEIKDIDTENAYQFGGVLALQELVSELLADNSELVKFLHRDMQVRVLYIPPAWKHLNPIDFPHF